MSRIDRRHHRPAGDDVATDLVQYLIVSAPDLGSLATLTPVLAALVDTDTMRILDAVVITRDRDGAVDLAELEAVDGLAELADDCVLTGELLTDRDIELASIPVVAPSAALVLVTEDRWAGQLAAVTSQAGGHILAGERIPAARVEAALADARERSGRED